VTNQTSILELLESDTRKKLVPDCMVHVPDSGTSFLVPESGTGFWYVCHGH